jgi:hypothetical protein
MNYMYNNQLDALFILSLLNYYTSICFGRINSPSSGGRMYNKYHLPHIYILPPDDGKLDPKAKSVSHFSPEPASFANRGPHVRAAWSASGDDGGN